MPTLEELSDYWEIEKRMIDYSTAIDTQSFDDLDLVFTKDAYLDYSANGGASGRYPEVKKYLVEALPRFPNYQHMIGNADIRLKGDEATSRTICFNPLAVSLRDGTRRIMFIGLWYVDRHVRTKEGWRIDHRVEEACFEYNVPGNLLDIAKLD
jgi:hypothetical protein